MLNERIVASFIYVSPEREWSPLRLFPCLFLLICCAQYYDSENITESKLGFRRATSEPWAHWQDDGFCMRTLYDMDRYVARSDSKTEAHSGNFFFSGIHHVYRKSGT